MKLNENQIKKVWDMLTFIRDDLETFEECTETKDERVLEYVKQIQDRLNPLESFFEAIVVDGKIREDWLK